MTTHAPDLTSFSWPGHRLTDALHALAKAAGYSTVSRLPAEAAAATVTSTPEVAADASSPETFVFDASAAGLDAEPFDVPPLDVIGALQRSTPAILSPAVGAAGYLVVLRVGRWTTTLIGPTGRARIATAQLINTLWAAVEASVAGPVVQVLREAGAVPRRRRIAASRALLAPSLAGRPLGEGWTVRPLAVRFRDSLRAARIYRRSVAIVAAYFLQFALFLAIWARVGERALAGGDGTGDPLHGGGGAGGLNGFGVMLGSLLGLWVVVQIAASRMISRLALDVGGAVRAGLVRGALRLDPSRIRSEGVGQLLGRALDAEVLDTLALGGGVEATAGFFELSLGAVVLGLGAAPLWSLALWGLTLVGVATRTLIHSRRLTRWSHTRRALTHDLVERMIGHRTTLIQDQPERRASADRTALRDYDDETRALDRAEVWLTVGVPRLWLLAALIVLALLAVLSSSDGPTPATATATATAMAMSVGGVWMVYGALRRLGVALPMLSLAREAWRQVVPLLGAKEAGSRPHWPVGAVAQNGHDGPAGHEARVSDARAPLLDAIGIGYQYPGRPAPVLHDVHFALATGDRVLVEGSSGGGKSTLAALLTGLKTPGTGTLRLNGVDQRTIGLARWRRTIGGAPQFHDNHVLGADLLFNLLMGRRWPPRLEDIAAAERVCRELGLGTLIGRMPAGLQQLVGETGWQLSHGERSRIFVARSLLQTLDARVLDESFAALDPETLDEVLAAVLSRPEALIVIAHP